MALMGSCNCSCGVWRAVANRGSNDFQRLIQTGARQSDLNRVTTFAVAHGVTVLDTNAVRRSVVLQGTVESITAAFAVNLNYYQLQDGKCYRGREGMVYVPPELTGVVLAVLGLDSRPAARRRR